MAVLTGRENGETIVPVADWQTHLGPYFKKLDGIKKFQYFR